MKMNYIVELADLLNHERIYAGSVYSLKLVHVRSL